MGLLTLLRRMLPVEHHTSLARPRVSGCSQLKSYPSADQRGCGRQFPGADLSGPSGHRSDERPTIRGVNTFVLIAAIVALAGAFRVTRFFYLKRYGPKSVEECLEEERDLEERKHQDQ